MFIWAIEYRVSPLYVRKVVLRGFRCECPYSTSLRFIRNICRTKRKSFRNTAQIKIVPNKEDYRPQLFNNATTPKGNPRIFRLYDVFMANQSITFLMKMYELQDLKSFVTALIRETLETFNFFWWRLRKYTGKPHVQYILKRR